MQIAFERMAEDDGLVVAMGVEQGAQVRRRLGQPLDGKGDSSIMHGGPRRALAADSRECPLANVPVARGLHGVMGEMQRRSGCVARRVAATGPAMRASSAAASAPRASISSAVASGPSASTSTGMPCLGLTLSSEARSSNSTASTGADFSARHRPAGAGEVGEDDEGRGLVAIVRHGG